MNKKVIFAVIAVLVIGGLVYTNRPDYKGDFTGTVKSAKEGAEQTVDDTMKKVGDTVIKKDVAENEKGYATEKTEKIETEEKTEKKDESQKIVDNTSDKASPDNSVTTVGITLDELKKHNDKNDCWVVYQGKVYDVTKWLPLHPGGVEAIARFCGTTGFETAFVRKHGNTVNQKIQNTTSKKLLIEEGDLQN